MTSHELVCELEAFVRQIQGGYVDRTPAFRRSLATTLEQWRASIAGGPPKLTPELRYLVVQCEQEINAERMGEATANVQQAWERLCTALQANRGG